MPGSALSHLISVFLANAYLGRRVLQIQGPPGSGKSRGMFLFTLFVLLLKPELKILWIAKQNPTLDQTACDFDDLLEEYADLRTTIGRYPGWHWEGKTHQAPFQQHAHELAHTQVSIITFGRIQSDQEGFSTQLNLKEAGLVLIDEAQQTQTPDALLIQACLDPATMIIRVGDGQQSPGGMPHQSQRDQLQYYKDRQGGALSKRTPFWTSAQYLTRMEDLLLAIGQGASMATFMATAFTNTLPVFEEVAMATASPTDILPCPV